MARLDLVVVFHPFLEAAGLFADLQRGQPVQGTLEFAAKFSIEAGIRSQDCGGL
ncbi:MAG: hypothetical protein BWY71_01717 [Planctomycetes bacterium ADurb.Bin412]|nr:MAG: hypothetical protein BWY71_01717 [Planctomycetes bacterium ADurb.Bin412]